VKKILVIALLTFTMGISGVATGLDKDKTFPEENTIVGKWKTSFSAINGESGEDIEILLILEFLDNGIFKIYNEQPEESMFDENGKYKIVDDIVTIMNNKCDTEGGRYKFEFKDNCVEFTRIEVECKYNNLLGTFFLDYDVAIVEE